MDAIQQFLSSADITSIIFYIFLFLFAFKGALEVSEYFYTKLKNFFSNKNASAESFNELKEQVEEFYNQLDLLKLSMQSYNKDMEEIKSEINEDEERILDDIRLTFKNKHHKYMSLGAIDDFTLNELEKKFAYYVSKGGNGYVRTLFNDIRELKVVDAAEIERLRVATYEREVLDD